MLQGVEGPPSSITPPFIIAQLDAEEAEGRAKAQAARGLGPDAEEQEEVEEESEEQAAERRRKRETRRAQLMKVGWRMSGSHSHTFPLCACCQRLWQVLLRSC